MTLQNTEILIIVLYGSPGNALVLSGGVVWGSENGPTLNIQTILNVLLLSELIKKQTDSHLHRVSPQGLQVLSVLMDPDKHTSQCQVQIQLFTWKHIFNTCQ